MEPHEYDSDFDISGSEVSEPCSTNPGKENKKSTLSQSALREEKGKCPTPAESHFARKVTAHGVLVLRPDDIKPGRWEDLSSYLKKTRQVKSLRLQGIEITVKELKILGESLKQIRHITFCDNSIGLNKVGPSTS